MPDAERALPSWDEPGVQEVAPGVHRVPLPLPGDALKAVNVYLLEDDDGWTLVDSGWDAPASRAALDDALDLLGSKVSHIRRVLVTHIHADHIGQSTVLKREVGAQVWLGEREREAFEIMVGYGPPPRAHMDAHILRAGGAEVVAERNAQREPGERFDLDQPDVWAPDGALIGNQRCLEALVTPGHTAGHLSFLDAEAGLLLSGDHVLPHITPSIGFEAPARATSLGDFLHSLARVRNLPVKLVLPAHGPVFSDLAGRVDELVAHHGVRLDACLAALTPEGTTAFEVAQQLGWTRRNRSFAELNTFNQILAIWETSAHLELLESRGLATLSERAGIWYFAPVAASAT